MQNNNGVSTFIRILVPVVAAVIFRIFPVPFELNTALHQAYAAEKSGNELIAAEQYQQIIEIQPWRDPLILKTADLFYKQRDWLNASKYFLMAREQGLLTVEGRKMLAETLFQLQNYDEAVNLWMQILDDSVNTNAEIFERITAVLETLGRDQDLISVYQKWIEFDPENPDAYYQLGLLMSLRDPESAIPMLTLAKTIAPELKGNVERLLSGLSQIGSADERYRLMQTGRALGSIGEWDYARQAFELALEIDPTYGEVWAFLGEAQQHLGLPSLESIQRANTLSPDSILVKALTAVYWRRQNDLQQALEVIDEIIAIEPDETIWLVEKGYALAQSGDLEAARDTFLQAIEREPTDPQYRNELIQFCLQNNYSVRSIALPEARQYLIIDSESSQSLDTMGEVLLALMDYTSARRYLDRAVEIDPLNASAHLHLGQVFLAINEPSLAYGHLVQAAASSETDPQAAVLAESLLERYFEGTS
jgi:tetratricopeptide (TPR) repeat protein